MNIVSGPITLLGVTVMLVVGCGRPNEAIHGDASPLKIVGGTSVSAEDQVASSTVALVSPDGQSFCTGSLVTALHVVTAAHCLKDYDENRLFIAFGTRATSESFKAEKLRIATKIMVHQGFSFAGIEQEERPVYDIALVQLNNAAPAGHQPVAVMRESNTVTLGEELVLAGFGRTSALWFARSGELRKVSTKLASVNEQMKEFDFGPTPGRTSCNGDSGGPAFVKRGSELALLGVTSRGDYCQSEGTYTDVRKFVDWLIETINLFNDQAS